MLKTFNDQIINVTPGRPFGAQRAPVPTGLDFVDGYLNEGMMPGEVYALLGPAGGGKTCLAVQLFVESARAQHEIAAHGGNGGVSYYFCYQSGAEEIQIRCTSYAAGIRRDRLEGVSDVGQLTQSEQDRIAECATWLNPHAKIIDMFDCDGSGRGTGYVGEIRACLGQHASVSGMPVAVTVIDHAGVVCDSYITARGLDPDQNLRHLLRMFGAQTRREISQPFRCPVWVLHPLSAKANARSASHLPCHSDASECRSFADEMDYAFCLGTTERTHELCIFTCSRMRRPIANTKTCHALKIDAANCRLLNADHEFYVDLVRRTFVPRNLPSMIQPEDL